MFLLLLSNSLWTKKEKWEKLDSGKTVRHLTGSESGSGIPYRGSLRVEPLLRQRESGAKVTQGLRSSCELTWNIEVMRRVGNLIGN